MSETIDTHGLRVKVVPAYDDRREITGVFAGGRDYSIGYDDVTAIAATREAGESGWVTAFEVHFDDGTAHKICSRDFVVRYATIEHPKSDLPF